MSDEHYERRVDDLLNANNALLDRARKAEAEVEHLRALLDASRRQNDPERWRHKVRGTTYRITGLVRIQCPPDKPLRDDELALLYEDVDSGVYSARRSEEFHDGRFERVGIRPAHAPAEDMIARTMREHGLTFPEAVNRLAREREDER